MKNDLLSKKLKDLRRANSYTQEDVAAALGVVRQTYSHYETGKRKPSSEVLFKLAGLYNISVDDLMQLTVDIDREVSFDAPLPTRSSASLAEYLEFANDPANKRRLQFLSGAEKELIFYFNRISEKDKKEIIEFTKIKAFGFE